MPMRRLTLLLLPLWIFGTSAADAMSCMPLKDVYVVSCQSGSCKPAFRVADVPSFGGCRRRPIVQDVDTQVGAFVAQMAQLSLPAERTGVFEIELRDTFWG